MIRLAVIQLTGELLDHTATYPAVNLATITMTTNDGVFIASVTFLTRPDISIEVKLAELKQKRKKTTKISIFRAVLAGLAACTIRRNLHSSALTTNPV